MTFDPNSLIRIARCFSCLPKSEIRGATINLLCRWANAAGGCTSAVVDDWVARVLANGGAQPSQTTIDALCVFSNALVSNGLSSKMIGVNCLVPDSLIAAQVPLIYPAGALPIWTNVNNRFDAADLTVDGLQGNSADARILATGIVPATHYANDTSAGLTCYCTSTATDAHNMLGAYHAASNTFFQLIVAFGGALPTYWDCWNSAAGRLNANGLNQGRGYTSGNRIGNLHEIYIASGSVAHQTIATANDAPTSRANLTWNIGVFAAANGVGTYTTAADKRFSFVAIHQGLTSAESATFFSLIHALRQALGGGFIP